MTRILAIVILIGTAVIGRVGMTQESQAELEAEIPGPALKYIRIAEPVFARKGLNVDNYTVRVFEESGTVYVMLRDPKKSKDVRGGGGFEVEIDKKTQKIIRSHYSR